MEKLGLDFNAILPETIVSAVAILVMLVDAYGTGRQRRASAWLALVGLVGATAATVPLWGVKTAPAYSGMLVTDPLRLVFTWATLAASVLTVLLSMRWLDEDELPAGEFYGLLLFATVGMMLMAGAGDMVMIFLGLEIVSIATYVMAGYRRRDLRSNESALKYYILGSFATAIMLYGMALVYGATRTTNLAAIQREIATAGSLHSELLVLGVALILVGFCFKVGAAPFHVWTPDVYEGAPSVVTGWMSTGPKAASFAALARLFIVVVASGGSVATLGVAWKSALAVIAVVTMVVGNVVAMVQDNIKRMLAYSSIAHAGYALVGVIAGDWQAVAFYMAAYALMNIGAFAVVATIAGRSDRAVTIDSYRGIGFDSLGLSATLAVFMFSLAGFPMTAGFIGKFLVFKSAWMAGHTVPVVVGVLASAASVYYYLRPLVVMFFVPAEEASPRPPAIPAATAAALTLAIAGIFYLGIAPGGLLTLLYGPPR
jgi:NADH-quinone oxidoreductase subunit N